jgi:hypothetical protein
MDRPDIRVGVIMMRGSVTEEVTGEIGFKHRSNWTGPFEGLIKTMGWWSLGSKVPSWACENFHGYMSLSVIKHQAASVPI